MLKKKYLCNNFLNLLYYLLNKCIDCFLEVFNFILMYDVYVIYILIFSGEKEVDLEFIKGSFV